MQEQKTISSSRVVNLKDPCPSCDSETGYLSKGSPSHAIQRRSIRCEQCDRFLGWLSNDATASKIIYKPEVEIDPYADDDTEITRYVSDQNFDVLECNQDYTADARVALPPAPTPRIDLTGLNAGQLAAVLGLSEWALNTDKEDRDRVLLAGKAGTGKTYAIAKLIEYLILGGFSVCICAPTHQALGVIRESVSRSGLKPKFAGSRWKDEGWKAESGLYFCTIHKLLGLRMSYDGNGDSITEQSGNPTWKDYDFIVVDECSMIGGEIYQYIPPYSTTGWIFMGDINQLEPVEPKKAKVISLTENGILIDPRHSPTFCSETFWDLTEVMRNSGAILEYCTNITEGVYHHSGIQRIPAIDWENEMVHRFVHHYANGTPQDIKALAWSNRRVLTLNNAIRNVLFEGSVVPFERGERLVARESIAIDKSGRSVTVMYSCQQCTVINYSIEQKILSFAPQSGDLICQSEPLKVWRLILSVDNQSIDITIDVLHESERENATVLLNAWRQMVLEIPSSKARSQSWHHWYGVLDQICLMPQKKAYLRKLQCAFASTIHQSQGSTYKEIFADNDVFGCKDPILKRQLLYVQASRASEKLVLRGK